jgi:hypothetical protein
MRGPMSSLTSPSVRSSTSTDAERKPPEAAGRLLNATCASTGSGGWCSVTTRPYAVPDLAPFLQAALLHPLLPRPGAAPTRAGTSWTVVLIATQAPRRSGRRTSSASNIGER